MSKRKTFPKRHAIIQAMKRANGDLSSDDASRILDAVVSRFPAIPIETQGVEECVQCGYFFYKDVLALCSPPSSAAGEETNV